MSTSVAFKVYYTCNANRYNNASNASNYCSWKEVKHESPQQNHMHIAEAYNWIAEKTSVFVGFYNKKDKINKGEHCSKKVALTTFNNRKPKQIEDVEHDMKQTKH